MANLSEKNIDLSEPDKDDLYALNNFVYRMPNEANDNIIVSRKYIRHYASQQSTKVSSGGGTAQLKFNLQSGDSYIFAPNSYLSFDLTVEADDAKDECDFGTGSVGNLFQGAWLTSESGVEIDSMRQNLNQKIWIEDYYQRSKSYHETHMAELQGYGVATLKAGGIKRFTIPISKILSVFNTAQPLPGFGFISGSILTLQLETINRAFKWTDAAGARSYTISDAYIEMESLLLTDWALDELNKRSMSNGLAITVMPWESNTYSPQDSRGDFETKKAVSRCLQMVVHIRGERKNGTDEAKEDTFKPEAYSVRQYQFSNGSVYFPNTPVDDVSSAYINTLNSYGKLIDFEEPPNVTFAHYKGAGNDKKAVLGQSFERSLVLQATGLPVNQSRNGICHVTFAAAAKREVTVFMKYLRICKKFANVVRIEE